MSGGSMDYFCFKMEEYCDRLKDKELVELAKDMAKLFHDAEWFESGDIGEGNFRKSVLDFKKKWFETPREESVLKYIEAKVKEMRLDLGIGDMCKDCKHFQKADSGYGNCPYCKHCMVHGYDEACEFFEVNK